MKNLVFTLLSLTLLASASARAEQAEEEAMTCEQLQENYTISGNASELTDSPDLFGACEDVVMRNGSPYIKVKAVVRRANSKTVTLYVPATDRTVQVTPQENLRVVLDGRKVRPSRLERGQEIRIYLSVPEFTRPKTESVQQVAMVTETEEIVEVAAAPVATLPTTASPLPTYGLIGGLLLAAGLLLRRWRLA